MLIALFSALVALAISNGHDASAHGVNHAAATPVVNQKQLALRNDMRKLWEDHVTWTRLAIISLTTDSPDTDATVGRLLRNQVDIGNAIKPFYGNDRGNQLTALLHDHIAIAGEILQAVKTGDTAAYNDANARWYANAHDIAVFFSQTLDPPLGTLAEMDQMMKDHLDTTTAEVVARHNGDWTGDVAAYDKVHTVILQMADMLSAGIIDNFPSKFR